MNGNQILFKMKFGHLFEFHKIPEWYTEYVHYRDLKDRISDFKRRLKQDKVRKLKGYYMVNKKGQFFCIDFIKDRNTTPVQHKRRSRKLSMDHNDNEGIKPEFHKS